MTDINTWKDYSQQQFDEFLDANQKDFEGLLTCYKCALMEVETKFKVLNENFTTYYDRNPIEYMKARMKKNSSLFKKINKYQIELSLESIEKNIYDIAGLRIVTSFIDDIYRLEKMILSQDDITLIQRKDYIANPKENGYRSLHLVIEVPVFLKYGKKLMRVEVQLRTIAMDFWASLDHKIRYKQDLSEEKLNKIASDLELCAAFSHELDLRMQDIRTEIEKN